MLIYVNFGRNNKELYWDIIIIIPLMRNKKAPSHLRAFIIEELFILNLSNYCHPLLLDLLDLIVNDTISLIKITEPFIKARQLLHKLFNSTHLHSPGAA